MVPENLLEDCEPQQTEQLCNMEASEHEGIEFSNLKPKCLHKYVDDTFYLLALTKSQNARVFFLYIGKLDQQEFVHFQIY